MSTEQTKTQASEVNQNQTAPPPYLLLSVEEIRLPEITNVRPFSSKQDGEKEIASINALMLSIEQEGQIEPVVVMPIKDPKPGEPVWDLVAGRRRLKAITQLNLASDKPVKVKCVVGDAIKQTSQLFRRASHENLMREDISAIDFAHNIRTVRERIKNTKKIAEFFGCSEAQITQHEKLLDLDEEYQQAIADGRLTREGAYALLKVAKTKRKDVYDAALKKQKTELGEGIIMWAASPPDLDPTTDSAGKGKGKRSGAAKAGGVKAKHVKQAAREADPDSRQARSKKEIVEWFEGMLGSAYGHSDGAVHVFVGNFLKWVKGEIQDRTLDKYWNALVECAPKGTAPKPENGAPKSKK